ncbi:MAG: hypothetical protein ACFE9Q_04285 [Candidatus Hodarchaeota archaeon]
MDLQKDYEKLYQHWLEEFQQTDLTELKEELFKYYKRILNFINEYKLENRDDLKNHILNTYKENITFLFKDFLKIREIKIINSALLMGEINLNNVIEAEKLLYQNLISSIKGYNKVKAISLYGEEGESKFEDLIESVLEPKSPVLEESKSKNEVELIIGDSKITSDKEKIKFVLVRFLKGAPPLVGIDLINYGPFEEDDIANLPEKNAKILIYEKFAEEIEIS